MTQTFEEFMGDAFEGEPMQLKENLQFRIKVLMEQSENIERLIKQGMPSEISGPWKEANQEKLTIALRDVREENYEKFDREIKYHQLYMDYYARYYNLIEEQHDANQS